LPASRYISLSQLHVASLAGNHAMDWGADALLDTVDLLRTKGIQTIGAGRNLAEAREPAMIEAKGLRIAMLAYCSVLHEGYAAGPDTPGVAPMRAHARLSKGWTARSIERK
jgi:poly-gamma-glutamate capsule biosynthesis protein CapA/YwtB (metallophosphatase superfamily)